MAMDPALLPPAEGSASALRWAQLTALFFIGLSSWLLVSGVFAAAVWELSTAPEGNTLFSHLDVTVQTANLAPAALILLAPKGWAGRHSREITGVLLTLGVVTALWLMCAAGYQTAGASVGLLVGSAAAGVLGCASMVSFFPYAATVGEVAGLTALSTGVGACGLVAQVLSGLSKGGALLGIQGYFAVVLALQLAGTVSFGLLERARSRHPLLGHCSSELAQQSGTVTEAVVPNIAECTPEPPVVVSGGISKWLKSHGEGMRTTGLGPLLGITLTAMLQYAMPGLLPYLCAKGDKVALFWLTALWNACAMPGRMLAAVVTVSRFGIANAIQAVIMMAAIFCSATGQPPSLAFSLPAVALFSGLHGLVVTRAFVAAGTNGGASGAAYCGLFNQVGAWVGSLLSLLFVALKLSKK